jgi:hypothetical protein
MSKSCQKVVTKSCHKKLSPSELKPKTRKTGKFERRRKKEETTKNGMKNEEGTMKKLGIRRLDATLSHLVNRQNLQILKKKIKHVGEEEEK